MQLTVLNNQQELKNIKRTSEGYRIVGNHSAVKVCEYTKKAIRGKDVCYKNTFYGIESWRCIQMSPTFYCNHRCVFCWRDIDYSWPRWQGPVDDPKEIVDGCIKAHVEEEVFKKPSMSVNEINLDKIKLPLKEILEKVETFRKKTYPKELQEKIIVILQNLDDFGDIWNITYITKAFNTLNIKISAENGKVLQHKLSSIFDFKKEDS